MILLQSCIGITKSDSIKATGTDSVESEDFEEDQDEDDEENLGLMERLERVRSKFRTETQDNLVFNFKKTVDAAFSVYASDKEKKEVDNLNMALLLNGVDSDIDYGHKKNSSYFDTVCDNQIRLLLKKDLNGNGLMLLKEFFKSNGYDVIKQKIGKFVNFFLQVPDFIQKNANNVKKIESYYPNICKKRSSFEYIYDEKEDAIGIRCTIKDSKKITIQKPRNLKCEETYNLSIDLQYIYSYLFRQVETRVVGIDRKNPIEVTDDKKKWSAYQLLGGGCFEVKDPLISGAPVDFMSVNVTPGNRLNGLIKFTLSKSLNDSQTHTQQAALEYEFDWFDKEKVTIETKRKEKKSANEVTTEPSANQADSGEISVCIDVAGLNIAETPAALKNTILIQSFRV